MPYMHANGARLCFEDTLDGQQPIAFTHNLMFSCRMFDDQIETLRSHDRCIAYDFRGQGRSEITTSGYDMDTLADDAAALIEGLGGGPCHFVGFSMGGFVGIRLAARRPALLRSLILASTSAEAQPWHTLPSHLLLNLVSRWLGPRSVAGPIMRLMFSHDFLADPGQADL
jgi:3-oxoadipate enol-lactonase